MLTILPKIINDSSLILYLDAANPFSYPGSGDTWFDLSKYRQNVPLFNSPTFNNLGLGSLQFNGSTQYGRLILSPGITTSPFTISSWIYSLSTSIGAISTVGAALNEIIENIMNNGGSNFYYSDYNTININVPYSNNTNSWFNVVLYFDSSFLAKIYINGTLAGQQQGSSYSVVGTSLLTLGAYSTFAFSPFYHFNGYISNYSIYNRALSEQEIQQNYNALKGRFGL